MDFQEAMELVGKTVDVAGVSIIVLGALGATVVAVRRLRHRGQPVYRPYRQQVGRSILLGLEFLVAADIIRTVAISPTFTNVGVLGLVVLIRTVLSFTLELEISGRWPWQEERADASAQTSV